MGRSNAVAPPADKRVERSYSVFKISNKLLHQRSARTHGSLLLISRCRVESKNFSRPHANRTHNRQPVRGKIQIEIDETAHGDAHVTSWVVSSVHWIMPAAALRRRTRHDQIHGSIIYNSSAVDRTNKFSSTRWNTRNCTRPSLIAFDGFKSAPEIPSFLRISDSGAHQLLIPRRVLRLAACH